MGGTNRSEGLGFAAAAYAGSLESRIGRWLTANREFEAGECRLEFRTGAGNIDPGKTIPLLTE